MKIRRKSSDTGLNGIYTARVSEDYFRIMVHDVEYSCNFAEVLSEATVVAKPTPSGKPRSGPVSLATHLSLPSLSLRHSDLGSNRT